jgi:Glycosyltransferase family 87
VTNASTRHPSPSARGAVVLVRIALVLLILGELYVTAVHVPGLLHPTAIGTDASNYYAAGQRLNDGHELYGPMRATDRRVPGYPGGFPAPLLSPPLVAVIWRPLATLGETSMKIWWAADLALLAGLAAWFAAVGGRWTLGGLSVILGLGWLIALALQVPYRYLGNESPLSIAALSGNLNGYLTGLCVLVWWASSRGRSWIAGIGAGLAAVLKLGPFVLVWWLVVRRDWPAVKAFSATVGVLAIVGLLGAGLDANLAFARLALGGGVASTPLSVPGMLHTWLHVDPHHTAPGTIVATVVGLAAVYATRRQARISFLVAILVVIYSSPVVLTGNFALLLAAVAPWVVPGRSATSELPGPAAATATATTGPRESTGADGRLVAAPGRGTGS